MIGSLALGPAHPIRLQSMTNTAAADAEATARQAMRIFDAGADLVRLGIPNREAAQCLPAIRKMLQSAGYEKPLIADIHFDPALALLVAPLVEKVRINPGNYTVFSKQTGKFTKEPSDEQYKEALSRKLSRLAATCKEYGTAIRIGTNLGSLSPRMLLRHGHTAEALVESTLEFIAALEYLGFFQMVVSLKASQPQLHVQAHVLMARRMLETGSCYPLHLGVTEAGEGMEGVIRSALGIYPLLDMGLGDTIRVSLTTAPEEEIPVARAILGQLKNRAVDTTAPAGSFSLEAFEQAAPYSTALPGTHKALLAATGSSGPDGPEQDICLVVPQTGKALKKPRPPAGSKKPGEANEPKSIPAYFTLQELLTGTPDDDGFRILLLSKPPGPRLMEQIRTLPGLIIAADADAGFPPDEIPALSASLKKMPLPPALLVKSRCAGHDRDTAAIALTALAGGFLMKGLLHGLWLDPPKDASYTDCLHMGATLLHQCGLRISQTEFISCPGCVRTSFDLFGVLKQLKELSPKVPGLKIAVMGCIVNGPGEMAGCDYGMVGMAKGKVALYRGKEMVARGIAEAEAAGELMELIRQEGKRIKGTQG